VVNFNTVFGGRLTLSDFFRPHLFIFKHGSFSGMKNPGGIFFEKWFGDLIPSTFWTEPPGRAGIPRWGDLGGVI
jgi:hypothetical protein